MDDGADEQIFKILHFLSQLKTTQNMLQLLNGFSVME